MKKKLIAFLILSLFYLGSCQCPEPKDKEIFIYSCRAKLFSKQSNGLTTTVPDNFNRNDIRISIAADSILETITSQFNFSFLPAAYATSCSKGTVNYLNTIDSISVITLYDYDSNHLANSNVTDILFLLNSLGDTSNIHPSDQSLITNSFKFSPAPTFDTLQFLVTGKISSVGNFQVKTEKVILKD